MKQLPVAITTFFCLLILLSSTLSIPHASQAQPAMNSQDIERASKLLDETNREQRS